ncbi:MAG: IPT/TIG domain-containing protein, partial [Candidatus Dormibacteraeota bacterium]|nr:IPT/TIG domain-containing protein [Candidatus Dormibacteraeota bacterium]
MKRLLRAAAAVGLLGGLFTLVADASETNVPTISNLSTFVVSGGTRLTIAGDHLSSDLPSQTGDCSLHGGPTVRFYPYNSPGHLDAAPISTDGSNCSNSFVNVTVPQGLTGAARVSAVDYHGNESNTGPGGFIPVVTVQPVASLNPSAGQVGTTVTIQGSNFRPPSLAPGATLSLSIGGAPRTGSWGPSSITFSPGNSSGEVQASFKVSTDSGDPGNPAKQVSVLVDAGNYSFLPPSLDGASAGHHVVGDRITLNGRNLGSSGSVTFPGGRPGVGVSWGSNSVSVTVPAGAQPGTISAYVNGFGSIAGPSITLDPKAGALSPSAASANQAITLTGYNFGAATGTIAVGSAPEAVTGWADQGVSFSVSADTDGGPVTLTRADGASIAAGTLAVVPHLERVETDSVPAGAQVVVDGVSLGAAQGTATVGAVDAPVLLWSRSSVLLQVPTTLGPGSYPVVVSSASGAASNPLSLT